MSTAQFPLDDDAGAPRVTPVALARTSHPVEHPSVHPGSHTPTQPLHGNPIDATNRPRAFKVNDVPGSRTVSEFCLREGRGILPSSGHTRGHSPSRSPKNGSSPGCPKTRSPLPVNEKTRSAGRGVKLRRKKAGAGILNPRTQKHGERKKAVGGGLQRNKAGAGMLKPRTQKHSERKKAGVRGLQHKKAGGGELQRKNAGADIVQPGTQKNGEHEKASVSSVGPEAQKRGECGKASVIIVEPEAQKQRACEKVGVSIVEPEAENHGEREKAGVSIVEPEAGKHGEREKDSVSILETEAQEHGERKKAVAGILEPETQNYRDRKKASAGELRREKAGASLLRRRKASAGIGVHHVTHLHCVTEARQTDESDAHTRLPPSEESALRHVEQLSQGSDLKSHRSQISRKRSKASSLADDAEKSTDEVESNRSNGEEHDNEESIVDFPFPRREEDGEGEHMTSRPPAGPQNGNSTAPTVEVRGGKKRAQTHGCSDTTPRRRRQKDDIHAEHGANATAHCVGDEDGAGGDNIVDFLFSLREEDGEGLGEGTTRGSSKLSGFRAITAKEADKMVDGGDASDRVLSSSSSHNTEDERVRGPHQRQDVPSAPLGEEDRTPRGAGDHAAMQQPHTPLCHPRPRTAQVRKNARHKGAREGVFAPRARRTTAVAAQRARVSDTSQTDVTVYKRGVSEADKRKAGDGPPGKSLCHASALKPGKIRLGNEREKDRADKRHDRRMQRRDSDACAALSSNAACAQQINDTMATPKKRGCGDNVDGESHDRLAVLHQAKRIVARPTQRSRRGSDGDLASTDHTATISGALVSACPEVGSTTASSIGSVGSKRENKRQQHNQYMPKKTNGRGGSTKSASHDEHDIPCLTQETAAEGAVSSQATANLVGKRHASHPERGSKTHRLNKNTAPVDPPAAEHTPRVVRRGQTTRGGGTQTQLNLECNKEKNKHASGEREMPAPLSPQHGNSRAPTVEVRGGKKRVRAHGSSDTTPRGRRQKDVIHAEHGANATAQCTGAEDSAGEDNFVDLLFSLRAEFIGPDNNQRITNDRATSSTTSHLTPRIAGAHAVKEEVSPTDEDVVRAVSYDAVGDRLREEDAAQNGGDHEKIKASAQADMSGTDRPFVSAARKRGRPKGSGVKPKKSDDVVKRIYRKSAVPRALGDNLAAETRRRQARDTALMALAKRDQYGVLCAGARRFMLERSGELTGVKTYFPWTPQDLGLPEGFLRVKQQLDRDLMDAYIAPCGKRLVNVKRVRYYLTHHGIPVPKYFQKTTTRATRQCWNMLPPARVRTEAHAHLPPHGDNLANLYEQESGIKVIGRPTDQIPFQFRRRQKHFYDQVSDIPLKEDPEEKSVVDDNGGEGKSTKEMNKAEKREDSMSECDRGGAVAAKKEPAGGGKQGDQLDSGAKKTDGSAVRSTSEMAPFGVERNGRSDQA